MKLPKILIVVLIAVWVSSCARTVYVTTKLNLPEKPAFPEIQFKQIKPIFQCGDYFTITPEHCRDPIITPFDRTPAEVNRKIEEKILLQNKYILQLEATIRATHK